ncbi:hypothetical protein CK203_040749 [Vitis vinifera]|uniref:Uncharacterized protein n=1 Tax=Vitis vinifera TaxID=29760 RepID=A0A438HF32_VITVI|nr:hypothetical protein CK203_040749 [Vitis vinifera]
MHPHPSLCTLDYPRVLRDGRAFTIKKPPGNARKCMCGGNDHLAWKHPVSLEACRGLRTVGGFHSYTWVHLWTFRAALVTIGFGYPFLSLLLVISIFVGEFTVTSLYSPSWIRVGGRLTRASDQSDQRSDQRDMDSQQTQQIPVQENAQFDTTVSPPPLPSQSAPQAIPFTLHSHIEVTPPPVTSPIPTSEDPHTYG